MRAAARAVARSSPLRLTLALVAIFTAVTLATTAVAWLSLRAAAEQALEATLTARVVGLTLPATPDAIAALVDAEAAVTDPELRVLAYVGPRGWQAGNAVIEPRGSALAILPRPGGKPLARAGYVSRAVPAAGGILVVAESRDPVDRLDATFARLALWGVLPTLALSLAAGVWLSRGTTARVQGIVRALARIAGGDLSARVGAVAHDDDLGQIAAGVDRMAAAQEASVGALRQVSADIAHDLKTPLQRLQFQLDDLTQHLPPGEAADLAARARAGAAEAIAVFDGLLQIARIEGGAPLPPEPVDLAAVAAAAVELYADAAADSGHRLVLDAPAPVTLQGHRALLTQAVANLIQNAVRHTPPGSRVTVRVTPAPPVLAVTDDGPGIPADERGRVLRPLYRLDRSRGTPGHGLGLPLVAAVAAHHGARLDLEDAAPGLSARLVFPAAPPATA